MRLRTDRSLLDRRYTKVMTCNREVERMSRSTLTSHRKALEMAGRDMLISGAQVATNGSIGRYDVVVRGGLIESLVPPGTIADTALEQLHADGKLLMPGVVDIHVHFREPGHEYKATYASESRAAAAGGVTTVCEMPNNGIHAVTTLERLEYKRSVARTSSYVDFGVYAYLVSCDCEELERLRAAGVMGLKWDMSLAGSEVSPGKWLPTPDQALPYFQAAARAGLRIGIHAEDSALIARNTATLRTAGRMDAFAHVEARTITAETIAIQQVVALMRDSGAQVHIHHLSSGAGLEIIRSAKREGLPISTETIPAFLFLDAKDYARLGTTMKIHPSVKFAEDRAALWEGLRDGSIDCLATDHAPHTLEEKRRSVWDASPGAIGVQTSLPLMLTAVSEGLILLERCVEVMCTRPAVLYGLAPAKGAIVKDADADLVLVNLEEAFVLRNEDMYSPIGLTPFDGVRAVGRPVATWLRGQLVAQNGRVVGEPHGRPVQPLRLAGLQDNDI